jgi:hypothetical protein
LSSSQSYQTSAYGIHFFNGSTTNIKTSSAALEQLENFKKQQKLININMKKIY